MKSPKLTLRVDFVEQCMAPWVSALGLVVLWPGCAHSASASGDVQAPLGPLPLNEMQTSGLQSFPQLLEMPVLQCNICCLLQNL